VKATRCCPKCGHKKILFLPKIADRTAGVSVPMVAHFQPALLLGKEAFGQITAYICRRCGYTELHTLKPKEIPWKEIEGAQILEPLEEEEPSGRDGATE